MTRCVEIYSSLINSSGIFHGEPGDVRPVHSYIEHVVA
jgi:hypothetical protein